MQARLADGRVLNFPDGTDPSVIDAAVKKVIANPLSAYTEQELENAPRVKGTTGDIARETGQGVLSGIQSLTDIFGANNAASRYLQEKNRGLGEGLTKERQQELEIEQELSKRAEGDTLKEITTGLKNVLRHPFTSVASGLGSSVPLIAGTVAAPEALVGRAALGIGSLMGLGGQKGQNYQAVYDEAIRQNKTPQEAEALAQKAQEYSLRNAPGLALGAGLGALEGELGAGARIGKFLNPAKAVEGASKGIAAPTFTKALGKSSLEGGGTEFLQGSGAQVASNIALSQAGFDTPLLQGAFGAGAHDALIGALTGSAVSPLQLSTMKREYDQDQAKKLFEDAEKTAKEQEATKAKFNKEMGIKPEVLALPAPQAEITEKPTDKLQNPLGNFTAEELGPERVKFIDQHRADNNKPPLKTYSIEDIVDAMPKQSPAERAALNELVANKANTKFGYSDQKVSAQDVLNTAVQKGVDTDTQGFKDFLTRATGLPSVGVEEKATTATKGKPLGLSELDMMTDAQRFVAQQALLELPTKEGEKTILPAGTNATHYDQDQYLKALSAVDALHGKGKPATQEEALQEIKNSTGLTRDEDAKYLLRDAVRRGDFDLNENNEVVPAETATYLPEGHRIEEVNLKEGEAPENYVVKAGDKVLKGSESKTEAEAQAKLDRYKAIREKDSADIDKEIADKQKAVEKSNENLERMEARGLGRTPEYQEASAAHAAFVEQTNKEIGDLNRDKAELDLTVNPLTVKAGEIKPVKRKTFKLHKAKTGEAATEVGMYPTRQAAEQAITSNMTEAELEDLAKDTRRRTLARRARQELNDRRTEKITVRREFKQVSGDIAKQLEGFLSKIGLKGVGLKVMNTLGGSEGEYNQSLIKVALDTNNPLGVLRHESIHALKDLGFFSDNQWNALRRMAKDKWIKQFMKDVPYSEGMSRYDAYKERFDANPPAGVTFQEYIEEEAIADAFRYFHENGTPPGMIAAILKRLNQFFEALRNALNNGGFYTSDDIFEKIEKGELVSSKQGTAEAKASLKPSIENAWKADPAEIEKADAYEEKNGILPYVSEGRLDLPMSVPRASLKTADKYGIDPVLGIPINKDGTVTVYYHTTKDQVPKLNASKTIPAEGRSRIYLTNESSGASILADRGNMDHNLDGSHVLLNIHPAMLQLDKEYESGRKDFYVPLAQGDFFNKKMNASGIRKSRNEAITEEYSERNHADRISKAIEAYKNADKKTKADMLRKAKAILKREHNVGTLLSENGKLEKTRTGEFGVSFEGNSIASMGLGLASAQKITDKLSSCPNSAICEGLCLGETSGGNFLYGGAAKEDMQDIEKSAFRAGPRMMQYLKTEAMIIHPEEFAILLNHEITKLEEWSAKETERKRNPETKKMESLQKEIYQPAIRLNVTSDFSPRLWESIITSHPDTKFYDYTKLAGNSSIAENHHLTYSSTGFGQFDDQGNPIVFQTKSGNYNHNWPTMRNRLDSGHGVAMAFSSKSALPKFLFDEETGKTYEVWNGDNYDARFVDPQSANGAGMIIGLKNKAATLKEKTATKETDGFFAHYDPKEGDTVTVPDQTQFGAPSAQKNKRAIPIARASLKALETEAFKQWFKGSKVVNEDGSPQVVYHGTSMDVDFTKFKVPRNGVWFSPDPKVASDYAKENDSQDFKFEYTSRGRGLVRINEASRVMPVFLNIKNPYTLTEKELDTFGDNYKQDQKVLFDRLKREGYDGAHIEGKAGEYDDVWIVLDKPTQIKSAIGNRGTFNVKSPDIRYSLKAPTTPAFKRFFGDSKVVDANGEPLVVYHATKNFEGNEFKPSPKVNRVGNPDGYYFTYDIEDANRYAGEIEGAQIIPAYLSIQKPFNYVGKFYSSKKMVDQYEKELRQDNPNLKDDWINAKLDTFKEGYWPNISFPTDAMTRVIKAGGYDGMKDGRDWVAFDSNQIKSATGNIGTFDSTNPDIRYSLKAPETPEFKRFFNGSKIVDKDGNPMVMYHGTGADITEFKRSEDGKLGEGIYTSSIPEYAGQFTGEETPNIMPMYISMKNPFEINLGNASGVEIATKIQEQLKDKVKELSDKRLMDMTGSQVRRLFERNGYDGIIAKDANGNIVEANAFKPEQLKSATGNVGTFKPKQKDIRYSLAARLQTMPNSAAGEKRVNETTTVRDEVGHAQRMIQAIKGDGISKFRQRFFNRYQRIGEFDKRLAKMKGVAKLLADTAAESAALMSDYANGVAYRALGFNGKGGIPEFKNGTVTVNQKSKGAVEIFAPLAKFGDPKIYQYYQFWAGVKRGSRYMKNNNGVYEERLFNDPADIQLAKDYEKAFPEFIDVQKEWTEYNNGLVKFLVDTGVLSAARAAEFTKYSDYIPFYRQFDDETTLGPQLFQSMSAVKAPKRAKGGEAPLADFLETIVRNTQSSVQAGMKAIAAQRAINNALELGEAEQVSANERSKFDVVQVYEKGELKFYRVKDPLYLEAMKGLNLPEIPFLGILAKPANWLRSLVTKEPGFMLANMMKDSMQTYITSGANITPIIDTAANFASAIQGKNPTVEILKSAGLGGNAHFVGDISKSGADLGKKLRKEAGTQKGLEKALKPFNSLWDALESGTEASDLATRAAIYDRVMKETGNEAEAIYQAVEAMNFYRHGNSAIIRILTAVTPFLNARMQGLDVFYRAGFAPTFAKLTGRGDQVTQADLERQKTFMIRSAGVVAMSVAYWALTHDDDEYKKQEQETRDNNWLIPALGIKIPIPFEIGFLFKVLPERIMEYTLGGDTGEDFAKSMYRGIEQTFGLQFPQAVAPLIETSVNYSFFTQRAIVPPGLENVDPEFQVGPSTSNVAEMIGKTIGSSPMMVDHLIKGYTGTLGMYLVDMVDSVINLNSDIPKASKRFEQMPIIKRFALDPDARGSVSAYYELKNNVDQVVRTINLLEKNNDYENLPQYAQENAGLWATHDFVLSMDKQMKEYQQYAVMIRNSSMDADEKRDALKAIYEAQNALTSNIQYVRKMISQQ